MSTSNHRRRGTRYPSIEAVAGNGLLNRRALLGRGAIIADAVSAARFGSLTGAAAEPPKDTPLTEPAWSLEPGAVIQPYQLPSRFEKNVVRR
jgi:sulfane dehydrogenase subunit SoxC